MAKYHLGCGDRHLDGYINVDIRPTNAADLVMDLARPVLEDADLVFSNAFFEHLYRYDRLPHLETVLRSLNSDGFVCYIGLPDFHAVAELYIRGYPGTVGPRFDLYNAYRYTHGDPEGVDPAGWVEQLHKGLLDAPEVARLLDAAGFQSHVEFSYVFPGEAAAVTLGFYATLGDGGRADLERRCLEFLAPFDGEYLELASLRFGLASGRRTPRFLRRSLQRVALAVDSLARR